MKNKQHRSEWILAYLQTHITADHLDRDFVEAYIKECEAPALIAPYGAPICDVLRRDLCRLFKEGKVLRCRVGLNYRESRGFPSWAYVYRRVTTTS